MVGSPSAPSSDDRDQPSTCNSGSTAQFSEQGASTIDAIEQMLDNLSEAQFRKLMMKKLGSTRNSEVSSQAGAEQDQEDEQEEPQLSTSGEAPRRPAPANPETEQFQ